MQNAQGTISSAILFFKFQTYQTEKKYLALKSTSLKEEMLKCPIPNFREQFSEKFDKKDKTYPRLIFALIN